MTPLDALRSLLGSYSEGNSEFESRLAQALLELRQQALPELGERLLRGTTSRGLKRVIMGMVSRFDWPEWAPLLLQALLQEQDLGVFDVGCTALGQLCTTESVEALRLLQESRSDPDRRLIVRRELETGATQHPKSYFFSRLSEGQDNPRHAVQAAQALASLVSADDLQTLAGLHQRADPMVRKLALKLMATLPAEGVGNYLLEALGRCSEELEQLRALSGLLNRGRDHGRGQAREELVQALGGRFSARAPELVTTFNLEAAREDGDPYSALEQLFVLAEGPLDRYLAEATGCLLEGKVARFAALQSEAGELAEKRPTDVAAMADECAEVLAFRVLRGLPPGREKALPVLRRCYESIHSGNALSLALACLIGPEDTEVLDLLLKDPDERRRVRALEILGAREEDAFAPFFIQALDVSGPEAEQVAIRHLGKLPSGFGRVMALFRSGKTEQIRLAIRVFGEARARPAGEALLEYVLEEGNDELVVEAVEALGSIVYPAAAPSLLKLLHDGKPLNLQLALVAALGAMETPEACLGLLDRAPHLKVPKVLAKVLQESMRAFPSFTRSFPVERLPDLEALVERCWDSREGEGHRLEAMFALQNLYTFKREAYDRLKERISNSLTEMRSAASWDRQLNDRVAGLLKELGRRAVNLSRLEEREGNLLGILKGLKPAGPARMTLLAQLRDGLRDPELLLREPVACAIADFVEEELGLRGKDWRELAHLCEIGGLTQQTRLVESIRDTLVRATGVGLKAAARDALLALGLTEEQIHKHGPIKSVLLLEPSAFFRKRLSSALEARQIAVAGAADRQEAQALLDQNPVDLLISESADGTGELRPWLEGQWNLHRCRQVLLATASRDLGELLDAPWLLGAIYKPFPIEQLLQAIEP
jgi:HEAT repeat protein